MQVISITPTTKGRMVICLSNGTDFCLYKGEVSDYKIEVDTELSEDKYQEILTEIIIPRAKKRAMHLLEKQDRSEKNLRSKLREGHYPEEAVDAAMAYLDSYGYLNDARMAASHIRFYQESRSRMRIRQDLKAKGIADDIIEICLDEEYTASELDQIYRLLEKKGYDSETATYEDKGKMYRFLASRGYSSSDISKALN